MSIRDQVLPAAHPWTGTAGHQPVRLHDSADLSVNVKWRSKKSSHEGCFLSDTYCLVLTAQLAQTLNRSELSRRVRQFRLRGGVFEVRARVLQRFFRTLACIFSLGFVEILATDRGVGENRHGARLDFENAAGDEHKLFFAVFSFDAHRTRTNPRDERRVTRQNAQFTRLARQRDELRLAREDLLFRADDVYLDSCHKCRLLG